MSKGTVTQLFDSLRWLNGVVDSSVARLRRSLGSYYEPRRTNGARPALPLPSSQPPRPSPTGDDQAHCAAAMREQVLAQPLSEELSRWIYEYSDHGARGLYLWQWCLHGVQLITLPCVASELRTEVCEVKFLSAMVNVLVDDVSDLAGNRPLLEALLKITQGLAPDVAPLALRDRSYAEFTCRLWETIRESIRRFPRYSEFKDLLEYDFSQHFNTVRYSQLIRGNLHALNIEEHNLYSPHGMMLMVFATLDLMCSPEFREEELGRLREVVWHAQWMARIGNLVTTWEREIVDGDFTSGVFAQAVVDGDLSVADLMHGSPERLREAIRRGGYEARFLQQWEQHRERIRAMQPRLKSLEVGSLTHGLERLLGTELASRGLK